VKIIYNPTGTRGSSVAFERGGQTIVLEFAGNFQKEDFRLKFNQSVRRGV